MVVGRFFFFVFNFILPFFFFSVDVEGGDTYS